MKFSNLVAVFGVALMGLSVTACTSSVDVTTQHTDCYYDSFGFQHCDTHYYNGDGTQEVTRDMVTDIAQAEETLLRAQGHHYAAKFSLSEEQGIKIAKTINDYNAVQHRSDSDVADFAQRLYGVNPSKIVSAVGAAQAGNNAQLNEVVAEAARNFNTSQDNMKAIVKSLHGKMLEQQGIGL